MRPFLLLLLFSLGVVSSAIATHNRAGEISYRKILPDDPNDFQYEITIVTCTDATSPADRPWLPLSFGDEAVGAEIDSIPRINTIPDVGIINEDESRLNFYSTIHTYPGTGTYIISMEDPNRNGGVVNMDESISQVFYIESMLNISPFGGHNNSVTLLYPAKDQACVNEIWEHNPGAFDIDGDSLVYTLVNCRGLMGAVIPSWVPPNLIEGSNGINDLFSVNSSTGTITWESPVLTGEYNIALRIDEYRDGFLVGYVVRDMQIKVRTCDNKPPVIDLIEDLCVIAGEQLAFSVNASDVNSSSVSLEAIGAPLTEVVNTANFSDFSGNPATGNFSWTPGCAEVRLAPYQVLFAATDNNQMSELVDIMELNITVIAPPTENFDVETVGFSFELEWDEHVCSDVIAYKIYRRDGFYGYIPEECETGVPGYTGYELLTTLAAPQTSYVDTEGVDFGKEFCYMIVACFQDGSQSIASSEICGTVLDLTQPVLTQCTVDETSSANGEITIQWVPPIDGDTTLLTSPYKFNLYSSEGFGPANTLIFESSENEFINELPREFVHELIDTETTPHAYRIELEDATGVTLSSNASSSIFLSITPDDNQMQLSWQFETGWTNTMYEIFRFDPLSSNFELIGTSVLTNYIDTGLVNNVEYCYYVKSIGDYNSEFDIIPSPIINFSQEVCSSPVDLTAPCPPELTGTGDCETGTVNLTWNNPNETCADDVIGYNVYFKPFLDSEYELIESYSDQDVTSYTFTSFENLTGCYYVTAVDSILPGLDGVLNQNESVPSFEFCTEGCPIYELPNVFSPQGDGMNDLLEPFPYVYVDSINLTVFNRWGTVVFETTDPDIEWAGINKDTGEISSDGVYFYTLKVYSARLIGVHEESFSGNITLLDGKKLNTN